MKEQGWVDSTDAQAMMRVLRPYHVAKFGAEFPISDRKFRLFVCAASRIKRQLDAAMGNDLRDEHASALARAEAWADSGVKPEIRAGDGGWYAMHNDPHVAAKIVAGWSSVQPQTAVILRDIIGNPFRPPPELRAFGGLMRVGWLNDTVASIAQAAYDERDDRGLLDPATVAVLADALEDAGCDNPWLIGHLRGHYVSGDGSRVLAHYRDWPHVRGCWAVDLILGKS